MSDDGKQKARNLVHIKMYDQVCKDLELLKFRQSKLIDIIKESIKISKSYAPYPEDEVYCKFKAIEYLNKSVSDLGIDVDS